MPIEQISNHQPIGQEMQAVVVSSSNSPPDALVYRRSLVFDLVDVSRFEWVLVVVVRRVVRRELQQPANLSLCHAQSP